VTVVNANAVTKGSNAHVYLGCYGGLRGDRHGAFCEAAFRHVSACEQIPLLVRTSTWSKAGRIRSWSWCYSLYSDRPTMVTQLYRRVLRK
jgi:hypothetical protein